jgi:two-component system cell cycle sensor histidine kinase/response regulator CckA
MEAVGRLAGGIAHDFNNVLSVILSYAELMLGGAPPDDPLRADIEEIRGRRAGDRAHAAAARVQPAAGARDQGARPVEMLAKMEKLLDRLLGADIS